MKVWTYSLRHNGRPWMAVCTASISSAIQEPTFCWKFNVFLALADFTRHLEAFSLRNLTLQRQFLDEIRGWKGNHFFSLTNPGNWIENVRSEFRIRSVESSSSKTPGRTKNQKENLRENAFETPHVYSLPYFSISNAWVRGGMILRPWIPESQSTEILIQAKLWAFLQSPTGTKLQPYQWRRLVQV